MNVITPMGFFEMYFNELPNFKTRKEAFKNVNQKTKTFTGKKFYKSFRAFKNVS